MCSGEEGRIIAYKCCNVHNSHLEMIFLLWDMLSDWKREKGIILNLTPVRGIKQKKKSWKSGGVISGVLLIIFLGKCSLAVHLTDLVKQAFLYLPTVIFTRVPPALFLCIQHQFGLFVAGGRLERSGGYLWQNCQIKFILIPVPSPGDPILLVKYTQLISIGFQKHFDSK